MTVSVVAHRVCSLRLRLNLLSFAGPKESSKEKDHRAGNDASRRRMPAAARPWAAVLSLTLTGDDSFS